MPRRISFLLLAVVVVLGIIALSAGYKKLLVKTDWEKRSMSFVGQANSLGAELEPGHVGHITVATCQADELVLLTPYCTQGELERQFSDRPKEFQDQLSDFSHGLRTPALVWIQNGRILSINRLEFTIPTNLSVKCWDVRGGRIIRIRKEEESPNGFLSIYFLEN